MPYINIRLGTALSQSERKVLYKKTTSLMETIMRKRKEVTVVNIDESKPYYWSVNSLALQADDPIAAYVDIKVTEGTNTLEEKAEMISETIGMLREVVGATQEACYVIIDEIPANSWGYNGKTQAARAASQI